MVNLFSYRKEKSILHSIKPGLKLVFLFILCFVTFWGKSTQTVEYIISIPVIIRTSVCLFLTLLLFILSGFHLDSLKKTRFVFVIGFLLTIFRMITFSTESSVNDKFVISFTNCFFSIDLNGLASGILYTIRFFITVLAAEVIFETTSILEIKSSIENAQDVVSVIFPPLKKWNPALILTLAINFIPEVFSSWNKVHYAAMARMENTKRKNLAEIIFIYIQQLQTLLSCLFAHAENTRKALMNRSQ
ncbi:MAG: hypothetical protein GX677_07410 [Treponema sp.]|jgi:energy-coupling factor transporter transmembrane protein EcfT|nr:hypothetical protein [Treponema sp.]